MQNKTKRFIINTIAIIAAVISLTIIMIPSVSVFAANKESVINIDAQQSLRDLSRVELVTAAFKKCVPKHVALREGNRLSIFNSSQVDVGPWLEEYILGSDSNGDGAIKCDEKNDSIIDAFAKEVGVNHNSILCNKNDNFNSPGLVALLVPGNGFDFERKQYSNNCAKFGVGGGGEGGYFDKEKVEASDGTSSPTFYFNPQGGPYTLGAEYVDGNDYVREVYAEWRRNSNLNKYLRTYGETNSDKISEYAYYYMDRQDYFAQCGEVKSTKEQGGMPISKVDANGAISTEYYLVQNQTAKIGKLDGQKTDCAAIAKRINNDKDEWRTKMAEIYKDECNKKAAEIWKFEYYKAQVITGAKASGMAVVVLPTGIYKLSTNALSGKEELINIEKSDDPLGTETTYTLDEAKSLFGEKFWQNYTEETDGEGNKVKKISSFTDKDKENANTVIADYKKYKKNYFADVKKNEKDEYGEFTCNVPDGWTVEDQQEQSSGDNQDSESGDSDPCYDAGVEGMSWVLCPVVNNTTNTVDSFESTLKTLLSIDSNSLFSDGVAYNIWEIFRNIANAILVIVFLVIIFSQLTGYGIDNYGIKKMLPKLIVMGVLINLSYIICELAVDLSNILGVGLNNLFESVASAANIDTSNAGSVAAIVLVVLGAAATTAASGYLTGGGAGIIVALVLALISALVALLIFLAMIGIRMIIVVVFTVISPVAFALYILPNTQNLFKKWWKVFEAALVVYPICGVLYGAHFIVKAILSGSSNIFMNIAAIIAPFLPFFALPSLLKSAMAGLGSVAGAITAAGTAFRRGTQSVTNTAKSAVEGSERYKNYQADRGRSRKLNFARKTNEKLTRRQNNGQSLSDRQKRRLESARMIENAEYAEKLKRDAIVDGNRYETMRAGIKAKDEDQAINDRLALMRSSGEGGGIMVGGQRAAYTLDNLNARMQELERKSRSTALSSDEQSEMAALARGMVSQKGGAGMLNNIVRNAGNQDATGKHQLNANFMSSLGQIYNNDSTVAGKMTEKDGGMGGYMERFMPGGDGVNRNESFDDYFADNSNNGYAGNASRRIKSHEAGLNQSGEAFRYYLGTLTKDQAQSIMDNQQLLNSLDVDNRTEFISHARTLGVTGPSARDVNVINVPHTP